MSTFYRNRFHGQIVQDIFFSRSKNKAIDYNDLTY